MIKSFLIIIWSILMQPDLEAQLKGDIGQYHYVGKLAAMAVVPIVHVENGKGWCAEARYNYEEVKTFSFYLGKSWSREGRISWTATPMAGIVAANYKGGSAALNLDLSGRKFFLSAQSQFTMAMDAENTNFFYNWSELAYAVSDHFFSGLTLQYTRQQGSNNMEPGLLAGVSFGDISLPVYIFHPFRAGRYVVLGLEYEFDFKKQSRNK